MNVNRLETKEVKFSATLEDKLVCSFKLAVNVVRGGVWQFVYDTYRPVILKGDLVGL